MINVIISFFTKWSVAMAGMDTITQETSLLFPMLSISKVLNTIAMPVVVEAINTHRVSDGAAWVDESWFEAGGVISTAFSLVLLDVLIMVPLLVAPPAFIINRVLLLIPGFASSYGTVYKLWEPPVLDVGTEYSSFITTLTLGLLYAPFYPPMLLISALCIAFKFWGFKFALVNVYAKPPSFNEEMAEALRKVTARLVLPLHVGSFVLAQINAGFDAYMPPIYAAVALVVLFIFFDSYVLPKIPGFGDWDQLASSGDTDGIAVDEVEEKLGYEVDFYAFPRLKTVRELKSIFFDSHPSRIAIESLNELNPNVLSAIRTCNLVSAPWTDHGPGGEAGPRSSWSDGTGQMLGPVNIRLLRFTGHDVTYHERKQGQATRGEGAAAML